MGSAAKIARMIKLLQADKCKMQIEELRVIARSLVEEDVTSPEELAYVELSDIKGLSNATSEIRKEVQRIIDAQKASKEGTRRTSSSNQRSVATLRTGKTASAEQIVKTVQGMMTLDLEKPVKGPMASCNDLADQCGNAVGRQLWVQVATLHSICASRRRSLGQTVSALRCWGRFANLMLGFELGREMPPTAEGLTSWGRLFRSHGTFQNYLANLSFACDLAGLDSRAMSHPMVTRTKRGIKSLEGAERPRKFIRHGMVKMLDESAEREAQYCEALLYIVAYAFLLRVPSEGLPLTVGAYKGPEDLLENWVHSSLSIKRNRIALKLARRKNKPHGAYLERACWCDECADTCPLHKLAPFLSNAGSVGRQPFAHMTPRLVTERLRARLGKLNIANPNAYRLHDFRRGHARDLQAKGANLREILNAGVRSVISKCFARVFNAAGQWSSAAFMKYLDQGDLETNAVIEDHIDESSGDD